MSAVAYVPDAESARAVVTWARKLAAEVEFVCADVLAASALAELDEQPTVLEDLDPIAAVADLCRRDGVDLLVSTAFERSDALIRASPCRTFIAVGGHKTRVRRVLVVLSERAHDVALLALARSIPDAEVTLATIEEDIGRGARDVGRRSTESFLRDEGADGDPRLKIKVAVGSDRARGTLDTFSGHDLVMVGIPDADWLPTVAGSFDGATVALVKRQPPLRRRSLPDWIPRINPSDFVDLIQQLREGSAWHADFIVMLAMAAAIASLGLIQNSAAVVIGSMLLAPLMTPMIGTGMALALANPKMVRLCLRSIVLGIVMTIAIGFALGVVVPDVGTLSPETAARGAPNVLDLLIALFAAIAASFALTRPGIVGAAAGVAIATALVPPACAVGISLAYGALLNALGAFLLFLTNFMAIVFASTLTFAVMGVSSSRAIKRRRRVARVAFLALGGVLLVLSVPLGVAMSQQLAEGRSEPLGHPVTRAVARQIRLRVAQEPDADVMFMARAAVGGSVVIYVASDEDLDPQLATDLTEVVRRTMQDPEVDVRVFAVRLAWIDRQDRPAGKPAGR